MIKAGRVFFERLGKNLDDHKSFVVETTLSGSYINKVAIKARKKGYLVKMIYIFVDDPEICVERVRMRVSKGGHTVPKADIIRRFRRSKVNFWENFTKLLDEWRLFYNGDEGFIQVAAGYNETYEVENPLLYELFKKDLI